VVPEWTARVVRASFPKGTLAMRIRDALGPVFTDEMFADAFAVGGRPAASPGALALVSVLRYAEGLSDRQAADQVRARMDWTCDPDVPRLITNVATTDATVTDTEMTELARVHFAATDCTGCRVRTACTNAAVNSKWGRDLTLLPAAQQQGRSPGSHPAGGTSDWTYRASPRNRAQSGLPEPFGFPVRANRVQYPII
jgi:hypothetical protein